MVMFIKITKMLFPIFC